MNDKYGKNKDGLARLDDDNDKEVELLKEEVDALLEGERQRKMDKAKAKVKDLVEELAAYQDLLGQEK